MIKKEWGQVFDLLIAEGLADRKLADPDLRDIFRGTVLMRTVMMLEAKGVVAGTAELDAVREMRNAVAHNQFDLSLNRNRKSLSLISRYHGDLTNGRIIDSSGSTSKPFFSLDVATLRFDQGPVHEACRQLIMKYI